VSLAFIEKVTQLFDSHNPRINWVWWPVGTWIDTPCSGTYGALQPAFCPGATGYRGGVGWGNILNYVPITPLAGTFNFSPVTPSAGTIVSFSAIGSGGVLPYSFSWNFGDGISSDGATLTHSYAKPGNYTVSLITSDNSEQTSPTSQVVDVHARQLPVNQPNNEGICLPCLFTPLLPMLSLIAVGTAYWFLTVTSLNFTRHHFRGNGGTSSQRTTLPNRKTPRSE